MTWNTKYRLGFNDLGGVPEATLSVNQIIHHDHPDDAYFHFGFIDKSPVTGKWVNLVRLGESHINPTGRIMIVRSNDGITWVEDVTPVVDSAYDDRLAAGGYDSTGRLHLFWVVYDTVAPAKWLYGKYKYSNDDGVTWSAEATLDTPTYSGTTLTGGYFPLNKICELDNGDILQPYHYLSAGVYGIGYYKSVDNGANWTANSIITTSTTYTYAEPSIVFLGGGELLVMARKVLTGANTCYHQFYSADDGANWTDQGDTTFETWAVTVGRERPPFITLINYFGIKIVACYYVVTDIQKFKVVYGLASDAVSGVTMWIASTITEIMTVCNYLDYGYTRDGYQTIVHLNNRWEGVCCIYIEQNVIDDPSDIYYISTPVSNRETVLIALGLSGLVDLENINWFANIEEDAFTGSITNIKGTDRPLRIEQTNGSDFIFEPIREGRVTVNAIATTNFSLKDLYSVDDMHFRVMIYNYGNLYFKGFVSMKDFQEPYDVTPYPVAITVVCGLEYLKSIKYDNSGTYYTGRKFESEIILDILAKIGHTSFTEFVNLYETRMNSTVDDSPCEQIKIDVDLFKDMYCYEVLGRILEKYNAVIGQKNGVFVIRRPHELISTTVYGRTFTAVSTIISTSITPLKYINRTTNASNILQVPGGSLMIQPPAKQVKITQDYGNKESWIKNYQFKGETYNTLTNVWEDWTNTNAQPWPVGANVGTYTVMAGEKDGVALLNKNSYPTLSKFISQSFGIYSLSGNDGIIFEFEYLLNNRNAGAYNNIITYIQITNGTHYLTETHGAGHEEEYHWSLTEDYITIEDDDVAPGNIGWVDYKRRVEGLPKAGTYTIKLYCLDDSSPTDLIDVAFKNLKFYATSIEIISKPVKLQLLKPRRGWIPFGKEPWKPVDVFTNQSVKEFVTIKTNEYTKTISPAINGSDFENDYILGDVTDTAIENVTEQFLGALSLNVSESILQAAIDFVTDHYGDYITGGVVLTYDEASDGTVYIIFTAEVAGVAFTGASSISNDSGDLDGDLEAGLQTANQSMVARIDTIELTGSSGTANITCEGVTKAATWDTSLNLTASNFVTAFISDYAAVNVILSAQSNVLLFTAVAPGTDFTINDTAITSTGGNLDGNVSAPFQANSSDTVAQVSTITLSGSTGTATITCDGVAQQIAIAAVLGHSLAWNTRGGAEADPVLTIIADEISKQHSRPKHFIQMAIQDKSVGAPAIDVLGCYRDDLNTVLIDGIEAYRLFIINRFVFDVRHRKWTVDMLEVIRKFEYPLFSYWVNEGYDTLNTTGLNITSAIDGGAGESKAVTDDIVLSVDTYIKIVMTFNVGGNVPAFRLIKSDGSLVYYTFTLLSGSNTFVYKITTTDTYRLQFYANDMIQTWNAVINVYKLI